MFLLEALAMAMLAGCTVILLPVVGIQATGLAFIAMYLVYLPVAYWRANRVTGLTFGRAVVARGGTLFGFMIIVAAAAHVDEYLGMGLGTVIGLAVGIASIRKLAEMSDLPAPVLKLRSLLAARFR